MKDYYGTQPQHARSLQAPYEAAVAINATALLAQSRDRPVESFNGLLIDSSIDLSVDAATALAPGLVR
jgi:hypothetical protein